MSKSTKDGGFIIVFGTGECSDVLDNLNDIKDCVEDNQDLYDETEMEIFKLVRCNYKITKKLTVEESKL